MSLVVFVLTACGGNSNDSTYDQFVAVASGTSLIMYELDDSGNAIELSSASLPDGLDDGHSIYGLTKLPDKDVIYASSLVMSSEQWWGDARIDRFSYDSDGILTYEGQAFIYADSEATCATEDTSERCVPTTTVFSSDGTRLYVDEDNNDLVQIFSVDDVTGELSLIEESASTSINGLAISPDDNYLYNGSNVIQLSDDTASDLVSGTGGNATEVVEDNEGVNLLLTTESNTTLAVYDLTDLSSPALIDSLALDAATTANYVTEKSGFYQAVSADLSRFIVVGCESIATVAFDGTTLTLEDQIFDTDDTLDVMNRSVVISDDGDYALVAFFHPYDADGNMLYNEDGGISTYQIADDGSLTLLDTVDLGTATRAVITVPAP